MQPRGQKSNPWHHDEEDDDVILLIGLTRTLIFPNPHPYFS
jgi:hypothetical protein